MLIYPFLTGCSPENTSSNNEKMPLPEKGMSAIHGRLISRNNETVTGIPVRLAKVYRGEDVDNAFFVLDEAHSPSTISNSEGQFIFTDIEPDEYVIFVGRLQADYQIISESEETPIVYEVGPNEILDLGHIFVNFNP